MSKETDVQQIWESYENNQLSESNPDADFTDIIYRVDLYNGNSQMLLMSQEIAEDLEHMDGPKKGGATVWLGEEYMYLRPNRPSA